MYTLTCSSDSTRNIPLFWQTFSSVQVSPDKYRIDGIFKAEFCNSLESAVSNGKYSANVMEVFVSWEKWLILSNWPPWTLVFDLMSTAAEVMLLAQKLSRKKGLSVYNGLNLINNTKFKVKQNNKKKVTIDTVTIICNIYIMTSFTLHNISLQCAS